MNKPAARKILRIANDLLETDPTTAHRIVRNLRGYIEESLTPPHQENTHMASSDTGFNRQAAVAEINHLVRLAWENPDSRSTLLPIIAAKKSVLKSSKKKAPKKVTPKKATKKATPKHKVSEKKMTGKKASPKKSPVKKATKKTVSRRRASDQLTSADAEW